MKMPARTGLLVLLAGVAPGVRGQGPGANPQAAAPRAQDLVAEVKESQNWLSQVKSFRVSFETKDDRAAPRSGAATQAEAEAGRKTKTDRGQLSTINAGFDERRFIYIADDAGGPRGIFWNGKRGGRSNADHYVELSDSLADFGGGFSISDFYWGRNGLKFWWTPKGQEPTDFIGSPQGYALKGNADFHGHPCYLLHGNARPGLPPFTENDLWVGVADHRLYGMEQNGQTEWYSDYREVAPRCWFPMISGIETAPIAGNAPAASPVTAIYERRVTDIAVDKGVPEEWFARAIPDGAHVHETLAGKSRDYVFVAAQTPEEKAQVDREMDADAARRKLFAPPPILPGQPIMLGSQADPLPLNPLATDPAAEFPAGAQWIGGGPVKLADLHAKKVVLIYFWASWQDFAERDFHQLGATSKTPDFALPAAIKDKVVAIGVHAPTRGAGRVEKAAQQHHMAFPICVDAAVGEKGWGEMAEKYRVENLPAAYVIDEQGKVAARGNWSEAVLRAEELLGVAAQENPKDKAGG